MENLLSRSAKKQPTLSTSNESEFKVLTQVTSEVRWFYYMFRELNIKLDIPPTLLFDNKSTILMAKNLTITSHSRHIEVIYYFVKEFVDKGALKIEYVPSSL